MNPFNLAENSVTRNSSVVAHLSRDRPVPPFPLRHYHRKRELSVRPERKGGARARSARGRNIGKSPSRNDGGTWAGYPRRALNPISMEIVNRPSGHAGYVIKKAACIRSDSHCKPQRGKKKGRSVAGNDGSRTVEVDEGCRERAAAGRRRRRRRRTLAAMVTAVEIGGRARKPI